MSCHLNENLQFVLNIHIFLECAFRNTRSYSLIAYILSLYILYLIQMSNIDIYASYDLKLMMLNFILIYLIFDN